MAGRTVPDSHLNRHYPVLDAARGLAALAVVLYHMLEYMYPQLSPAAMPALFRHSYLAVDLFFLMSGFVIARAYEARLLDRRLSFGGFMRVRLIRLYPLYLAGTLSGLTYVLVRDRLQPLSDATGLHLGTILLANLLFLPRPGAALAQQQGFFPYDAAAWSLALEWFVNLAYAGLVLRLRTGWLLAIAAAAGLTLIATAMQHGSLDMIWGTGTIMGSWLRIGFSFTLGVALFRLLAAGRLQVPVIHPALLLAGLAVILLTPVGEPGLLYELICMLIGFPLFVVFACQTEVSPRLTPVCLTAGAVSYALYILHNPLLLWGAGIWKLATHGQGDDLPVASSLPLLIFVIGLSYLATVAFDTPLRRRLSGKRQPIVSPAAAPPL